MLRIWKGSIYTVLFCNKSSIYMLFNFPTLVKYSSNTPNNPTPPPPTILADIKILH